MVIVDIQQAIRKNYCSLSKVHREIAEKVMQRPEQYFTLPISECASQLKVSEASLTRFSRAIGFKGFNELRKNCRSDLIKSLGIKEKMDRSLKDSRLRDDLIRFHMQQELHNFTIQLEAIDYEGLERLARMIYGADNVYIGGLGIAKTLVEFLKFRLRRMGISVRDLREGGYEFAESITSLKRQDMLLVIGFKRIYQELRTGIEYAKKTGCPVFAIAESPLSRLAVTADDYAVVKRGPEDALNSVAFPIAVCNAVCMEVARLREREVSETLDRLEWLNYRLKHNWEGED